MTAGASQPSQLTALMEIARERRLHTLLIREPAALAWLFGCRFNVPNTLDTACFDVVVSGLDAETPHVTVISNSIEAPRLQDTEFGGPGAVPIDEHRVEPWWGDRSRHFPSGQGVGSDRAWVDAVNIAAELTAARRILNPLQAAQLASLCDETRAATGRAARRARPGMTEYEVASLLSAELLEAEIDPVVLMVAADGRDRRHRHPLPTSAVGQHSFLLVCCGRRHGVIASVTRAVSFVADAGRDSRHRALLEVERAFLDASTAGARLGDVVDTGIRSYATNGFASDEWTKHHQGGLSGWLPREFPAHTGSDVLLMPGMVVAWNPSGDGCKTEDTWLVGDGGVETVNADPSWPHIEVGGRLRPLVLTL